MKDSLGEIEAALAQIPGVKAARLVTDEEGRPVEIHVVASGEKSPKQLVRDIQTVAIAGFGMEIDHRIISVVQFPDSEPLRSREVRPSIEEIGTEVRGKSAKMTVALRSGDRLTRGEATGTNARDALIRVAAMAALNAVSQMTSDQIWLEIDHVAIQRAGGHEVAVATVNVAESQGVTSLSGSAVITGLQTEAVVRAVLAAVNRRLWRATSQTS